MSGIVLLIWLVYPVLSDIRRKSYYLEPVVLSGAGVVLWNMAIGREGAGDVLLGMIPGALSGILCAVSQESLGAGDAVCIIICGAFCGLMAIIRICLLSFLSAGFFALILIVFKKAGKYSTLPFLPFLFSACVIDMLCS